jgi:hypothetical protein
MSQEFIQQIEGLLTVSSDACEFGCSEFELEKMLPELRLNSKKVRVVKNWSIWRLKITEYEITVLERAGLKNMMLYATVVYDSIDSFAIDTSVRSTLLINLRNMLRGYCSAIRSHESIGF